MIEGIRLTGDEFKAARRYLRLTQGDISRLAGVDLRTARRWEGGERPIPHLVARVLRIAQARPEIVELLRDEIAREEAANAP